MLIMLPQEIKKMKWNFHGSETCIKTVYIFSSPEQSSRRAIVLPQASALALALASTNVEVLR